MSYKYFFFLVLLLTVSLVNSQKTSTQKLTPQKLFLKVPAEANLITPTGVAINSKKHLFVVNSGVNKLMEFDAEGSYIKTLAQGILKGPHGLRIDKEDNIWVTDLELHIVLKLNPKGQVLMVLGQKGNQGIYDDERKMALFFKPADIAFGLNGEIYVADGYGNARIVKLDADGNFIKSWGQKGTAEGAFDNPHNVIVDHKGQVYVADRNNKRIQIFDANGNFIKAWTHLGKPWGLAITKDKKIFMTDGTNEKILTLNLNGEIINSYGSPGTKYGHFRAAHGIAIDNLGSIYVTEILNWRVQKISPIKQ